MILCVLPPPPFSAKLCTPPFVEEGREGFPYLGFAYESPSSVTGEVDSLESQSFIQAEGRICCGLKFVHVWTQFHSIRAANGCF